MPIFLVFGCCHAEFAYCLKEYADFVIFDRNPCMGCFAGEECGEPRTKG